MGSGLRKERSFGFDCIARVALSHDHLPCAIVSARGSQSQFLSQRPKRKQTNAKLTLKSRSTFNFDSSFHGITNMCGHIAKVRSPVCISGNPHAIIPDLQEVTAFAATANDGDVCCAGIDRVLHQLRDRLEWIRL